MVAVPVATHVAYDNLVAWIGTTAWAPLHALQPAWYRRAVSAVMLLVGEDVPEYVTAALDPASARLLAFTRERVVVAECAPAERETSVRAAVWARGALVSLEATSTEPFRTEGWPGRVRVVATYADGTRWLLPLDDGADAVASDQVVAFLPSLLADLGRAVRAGDRTPVG